MKKKLVHLRLDSLELNLHGIFHQHIVAEKIGLGVLGVLDLGEAVAGLVGLVHVHAFDLKHAVHQLGHGGIKAGSSNVCHSDADDGGHGDGAEYYPLPLVVDPTAPAAGLDLDSEGRPS